MFFLICSTTQGAAHVLVDIEKKSTSLGKFLTLFPWGEGLYALPEFIQNIANFLLVCHKQVFRGYKKRNLFS